MIKLFSLVVKTFCIISFATLIKAGLTKGVMYMTGLSIFPSVPIALLIMSLFISVAILRSRDEA